MSLPTVATLDPQVITAGPLVLPPQRRLMILLMLALAALLHVATSGWGPIENGPDGMNAAISRELALGMKPAEISGLWNVPVHATPVQWITAQSFRIFNVNELAARMPFAVANLIVVALVFLIAEKMGGVWRGLASGIIASTMSGTILHGRDGGGAAMTALLLTVSLYSAVRMLEQKSRFYWQIFYWCALAGLLTFEKPAPALLSMASVWIAYFFFREARIRLRKVSWIVVSLIFLGITGFFFHKNLPAPPAWTLASSAKYLWMLFPWSIVMLPPGILRFRKVLRLNELTPADAFLWSLFSAESLWVLLFSTRQEWPDSVACLTPAFALLSSVVWDRTSGRVRMLGVGLLVALMIGGMGFCGRVAGKEWLNLLQPIWWLSSGVVIIFGISALVALYLRHSRAALLTIAASVIPLAYNLLDARARYDWQHTLKDFGKKVEVGYLPGSQVYLDEKLETVSSFLFYAPHGLQICPWAQTMETTSATNDYLLGERDKTVAPPKAEKIGRNSRQILFLLPKN